ncbi:MAG: DUF5689 domain-containing protein [Flavobacteriales bacterium]
MKLSTRNLNKLFVGVLMTFTLFSCVSDDDYSVPDFATCTENVTTTKSFTDIKNLAVSESADELTANETFEAYVVSSDIAGEFYASLYIVSADGTEGMSFSIDRRDNYVSFEPGRQIFINTEGLYIAKADGGVALGGLYNGGVGRLESSKFNTAVTRGCKTINEESLVQKVSTISDAMSDTYLNKLIEIENVQFQDIETIPTYYDATNDLGGSTNHVLEDAQGNSDSNFVARFSSYADHAKQKVATGSGSIRGVLTKYGNAYQLIVRTVEDDIKFNNARFENTSPNACERTIPSGTLPFSDDFEAYTAGDSSTSNWNVIVETGSRSFQVTEYNSNKYMQMSAYNSGESNKTWMISPKFDISSATNKVVSFKLADAFETGNPIKLVYSTDYDGSDCPANFTWTEIGSTETAALINNAATYDSNFESTGNIDISSITGNAVFAIIYEGSASGITTTVQIDDFVVGQDADTQTPGGGISNGVPENVFFSEYAEGSSYNKYFEIYNGTGADLDLSAYKVLIAINGGGWGNTPLDLSGTLTAGDVYVVGTDALDASIISKADLTLAYLSVAHFSGDDAIALVKDDAGSLKIIDIIGDPNNRPTNGWDVAGTATATKDYTLIRKSTVTTGNIDWSIGAGTDASSSEWEVHNKDYWDNMGVYGSSQNTNTAPVAAVTITGTTKVDKTLTADTSASTDADSDTLTFTYQWYRADDNGGTNEIAISSATAQTYVLTVADKDKFVTVKVIANDGTDDSTETTASYVGAVTETVSNTPPVASVNVTGTTKVGETLTADTSTSTDADGDTLTFTYQWYRADDNGGTNETAISSATAQTYVLTATDKDKFVTVKVIANDGTDDSTETTASYVGAVTEDTNSSLSDLIISEYVEGSSYNKYIEIYNGTGSDIDLSSYSLGKDNNGDDTFSTTAALTGTLANGETIVYAHSSATIYTGTTQSLSPNTAINFNGDDQIALLKNGTIIDKMGVSGDVDFGKDVTLRRKQSVTGPSSTYTDTEWETLTKDDVSGLGSF